MEVVGALADAYLPGGVDEVAASHLMAGTVVALALVGAVTFAWSLSRRRKQVAISKAARLAPAVEFFKLLSTSEHGSLKRFTGSFHPNITLSSGVLLAMRRCVISELGTFVHINMKESELSTLPPNKSLGPFPITVANCKAAFTKNMSVPCEVAWTLLPKSTTQAPGADGAAATKGKQSAGSRDKVVKILKFNVTPPTPLNVMPHVDPRDFENEGEKFIASAFSNHPTAAHKMLGPTLKKKISTEKELNDEMVGVVRAMGGLKNKALTVDTASAVTSTVKGTTCMVLEYVVKGNVRDVAVKLTCALNGSEFVVLAFTYTALAASQKHVFVEK